MPIPDKIADRELYSRIKSQVKKEYKVWPSAYASGQLVQRYEKAGGRYKKDTRPPGKRNQLSRWYKENWVNVCAKDVKGKYKKCGTGKTPKRGSNTQQYPYCRPSKRVNKSTPMTVGEIKKKYGEKKIKEMCAKKKSSKRIKLT